MPFDGNSTQRNNVDRIGSELISDSILVYFQTLFRFCIIPCLSVLAVIANIINVTVFAKMGISDGVTQNFFILSISDGLLACCLVGVSYAYVSEYILRNNPDVPDKFATNAQTVFWVSYYLLLCPQAFSMIITMVIAIVRCCCVAMPLKVKDILTARRQLAAIIIPSVIYLAINLYACRSIHINYTFNPQINRTYSVLAGAEWEYLTTSQNTICITAFLTVVVCVVILAISLRRSSTFRASSTSDKLSSTTTVSGQPNLKQRDARVVKTVVSLCVVFIICTIPVIVYTMLRAVVPGFRAQGKYENGNMVTLMVSESALMVNVLVNIIIYYFYNTNYRVIFRSIFMGKQE